MCWQIPSTKSKGNSAAVQWQVSGVQVSCLSLQELDSGRRQEVEEVKDGGRDLALLAGIPGVLHRQQLLRLQPLLQVVYQLLACSGALARLGLPLTIALSASLYRLNFLAASLHLDRGLEAELTKGDIEPAGQELQEPGEAPQEGKL